MESRQDLPSFRHHLLHALDALGVEEALAQGTAADGRALARLLELLDELCAPAAALQPRTLSQFADLLRDAISHAHVPAATRAGIQVTDLAAAGSAPCDYLFLGGLVQGEFPRLPPADIFLEESQRRALNLDEDANTEAERLLFYRAICSPRRGLGLFHPKQSGSETLAPSPFVDELDALLAARPEMDESNGTPGTLAELHLKLGQGLCAPRASDSARDALALYSQAAELNDYPIALRHLVRGLHISARRTIPGSLGSHEGVLDGGNAARCAEYPPRPKPFFFCNPTGAFTATVPSGFLPKNCSTSSPSAIQKTTTQRSSAATSSTASSIVSIQPTAKRPNARKIWLQTSRSCATSAAK